MKALYIEGLATHDGPESCVEVRKGGGEALTGVRAGWAIEPRNAEIGVPTLSNGAEGNIAGGAMRESSGDPARSKNLRMCVISMRENREVSRSPDPLIADRAARARLRPSSRNERAREV